MIKKAIFILLNLVSALFSFGQVIKIQSGPSISNLEWSIDNFVPRGRNEYLLGKSAFIGVDYLNHRHFNLSTNIGYLQKGDRSEVAYTVSEDNTMELPLMEAKFEYLSANTTAEIKYPLRRILVPFVSVGPRFDFMISYPEELSFIKEIEELSPYGYGLNLGGGVKLDFKTLQLGVRSDYYLNMAKLANWVSESNSDSWIDDKTLLVNFTLGYKLR